jgi:hypothetical protein
MTDNIDDVPAPIVAPRVGGVLNGAFDNIDDVPAPIVAPRVGGVLNGVAWTGGMPTSDDRDGTNLLEPRTPYCLRPKDASGSLKIYAKQTEVRSETKLFGRTDPLSVFENKFLDHLEKTGMDSLPWMKVSSRDELVNLIVKHSSTTVEQVEVYYAQKLALGQIDIYERKNGEASKSWLLSAIEPTLRTTLYAKLDRDAHCMVVWMTLVAEIRSESYRYFEDVKAQLKDLKLSDFPGENVKDFTQAFALLADELETANLMEPHFIVIFVTALTQTSVNLFVIAMSGLLTRALDYNRTVRFLTEEARRLMPPSDVMSIRQTRGVADGLYQELFEGKNWPPAFTAGDRQTAPQVNLAATTEFTNAQVNALMQQAFQAGASGGTIGGGAKDISEVECFHCHKKGHYANKCPNKDNSKELPWKKKAPADGEPQIKTVTRDGTDVIHYWCAKCKRWTTSHNTLKHGHQGEDPVPAPPASTPPPTPAAAGNMAMDDCPAALVPDYESDEDGAWSPV